MEPNEIVGHYHAFPDEGRITSGLAEIEFLRTQEVVRRQLPDRPLDVLDVGGGTGVHAAWLAGDGHRVHVIDPVARQIEIVRRLAVAGSGAITASVGDARQLAAADESVDVVLLLGPLYHLIEPADRRAALDEAARVLRPGGLLFAAAVSRFASLFDGLGREFLFDTEFRAIVETDTATGVHRNPRGRPEWWTTAYFHRPDELAPELEAAGFRCREVVGLEGLAAWLPHLAARWDDATDRETILAAARLIEHEPAVRGVSAHLLAVAER